MPDTTSPRVSGTITDWKPEDPGFWESVGKRIAYRNLWISVYALLLAFCIWLMFSAIAVYLPGIGFPFSKNQLFWLTAITGLSGATLRIFYSFFVPIFGGRNWTVISTASLLIPAVGVGLAVQHPGTPYWVFMLLAALCGFGSANFASSMANISFFFPKSLKGTALGLNAGLGNLGVSVIQFAAPYVIALNLFGALGGGPQTLVKDGARQAVWVQNMAFFWIPFIIVAIGLAMWGMNNLTSARASFRDQAVIFRRKHNWLICLLYLGTFGSYIGYSASFPLLTKTLFPDVNPLSYAFIGALLGAVIRPLGGWLADKLGGARVNLANYLMMILAALGALYFIGQRTEPGAFWGFLALFIVLFLATGIGNGAVFRMIPIIFLAERLCAVRGQGEEAEAAATRDAAKESAAVIGFSSAIGAYGAFFIPIGFGQAIAATGEPAPALLAMVGFYVVCIVITWWFYARRDAETPC